MIIEKRLYSSNGFQRASNFSNKNGVRLPGCVNICNQIELLSEGSFCINLYVLKKRMSLVYNDVYSFAKKIRTEFDFSWHSIINKTINILLPEPTTATDYYHAVCLSETHNLYFTFKEHESENKKLGIHTVNFCDICGVVFKNIFKRRYRSAKDICNFRQNLDLSKTNTKRGDLGTLKIDFTHYVQC